MKEAYFLIMFDVMEYMIYSITNGQVRRKTYKLIDPVDPFSTAMAWKHLEKRAAAYAKRNNLNCLSTIVPKEIAVRVSSYTARRCYYCYK